jgi:FkbM family methyltransferase
LKTKDAAVGGCRAQGWWPLALLSLGLACCGAQGCRRAATPRESVAQPGAAVRTGPLAECTAPQYTRGHLREAEKLAAARLRERSKLLRRGAEDLELWSTPHGEFWVIAKNFETLAFVLAEQELNIYGDEATGVRPGDIVLDCGAHFGGYVRKALTAGAKLVVAIELAPENVACLRATFAQEIKGGRVIVYPKGVWDKDDELKLHRDKRSWGDRVAAPEETDAGPTVPLTTIDKIVAELRLARVDFIKMDIEGAEPNALVGAAATLRSFRPRMALAAYHRKEQDLVELPELARRAQPAYEICLWGANEGWGNKTLFYR